MKPNWFVAFPVHSGPWFSPLFTGLPRGIRQFHPVDLHITVAFLGAVSEEAAQAGFQALPEDLGGAVSATLGRMRGMGNRRRPSAYALTLEVGREAVAERMGSWRGAVLEAAGARPDTRAPLPHITVARPPRRAADALRAEGLSWMQTAAASGQIQLTEVALYTWSRQRRAQLFRIVERRAL